MTLQQLNTNFGIAPVLEFDSGVNGLPMIKIETPQASAVVSLYGAQLLSFQPKGVKNDLLFLSEKANYKIGEAIRGGVPICWPWFSREKPKPHLPNHGFARIAMWHVAATSQQDDIVQLRLILKDDAKTREMWNHTFKLTLDITIGEQLSLRLTTENTGSTSFQFSQAMHTYFAVSDIQKISLVGLEGANYIDTVGGENKVYQQSGAIQISSELDRIYTDFSDEMKLQDKAFVRAVNIKSSGSKTTVVWNPWHALSSKIQDLNDDAYRQFICVETVNTGEDVVTLLPAKIHTMSATYKITAD